MKLTDTQLVILSKAAQRDDRCIEIPSTMSPALVGKLMTKLADADFIEEIETAGEFPVWRTVEDQRYSLRVTDKGMEAIGIAPDSSMKSSAKKHSKPMLSKRQKSPPATVARKPKAGVHRKTGKRTVARAQRPNKSKTKKPSENSRMQRSGTKLAEIVNMLLRKRGATIDEIITVTGWQAHSVRGALSGTIKKKLGHRIVTEKHGDTRHYRIDNARD